MSQCPCLRDLPYTDCCGPIHDGSRAAATAADLMRARYTAFANGAIDFLGASHHPDRRGEFEADSAKQWSEGATWHGFEVVRTEGGGAEDESGVVEFIAHYAVQDRKVSHHEISEFERVGGEWFFVDGKEVPVTVRREEPKVGRNDPCPCGSGKKHKKCCSK